MVPSCQLSQSPRVSGECLIGLESETSGLTGARLSVSEATSVVSADYVLDLWLGNGLQYRARECSVRRGSRLASLLYQAQTCLCLQRGDASLEDMRSLYTSSARSNHQGVRWITL